MPPTLQKKGTRESYVSWDRIGIGTSVLCIVHCLVFPIVLALLPLGTSFAALEEWMHPLFLLFVIPSAWFAVKQKGGQKRFVKASLFSGVFILCLAWVLHGFITEEQEIIGTFVASILLITGHSINFGKHTRGSEL